MESALAQSRVAWAGALVPYEAWLALGLRLGAGAMGGDLAKSFVKRGLGIPPGSPWIPFDQIDFALGALVLVRTPAGLTVTDAAVVLALTFVGDIVVNHAGYALGVRDTAW